MTRLGSTFVSEDTDTRGQVGPAGNDSTVPGPAGEDSTVPGPAGDDGIVASVVAGTNVTSIDNTDPANPIINVDDMNVNKLDISFFVQGTPTDAEKLATHVATTAFTLPSGLTASKAFAEVVSTANATIDMQVNGVSKGSIDFALGASTATFTFASPVAIAAGDRIQFISQATADSTLADISFTIRGEI